MRCQREKRSQLNFRLEVRVFDGNLTIFPGVELILFIQFVFVKAQLSILQNSGVTIPLILYKTLSPLRKIHLKIRSKFNFNCNFFTSATVLRRQTPICCLQLFQNPPPPRRVSCKWGSYLWDHRPAQPQFLYRSERKNVLLYSHPGFLLYSHPEHHLGPNDGLPAAFPEERSFSGHNLLYQRSPNHGPWAKSDRKDILSTTKKWYIYQRFVDLIECNTLR